jgi:hypothetical protein
VTLAYVFWHRPRAGVVPEDYEAALEAFHAVVGVPSWFSRLARTPWLDEPGWYEDWYLVDDWAALGTLNETAVRGAREAPHNRAAAAAADGIAGIYALRFGAPAEPGWAAWVHKPRELAYPAFESDVRAAAGEGASLWQRQMTLGPTPEFAVLAAGPVELPWPAVQTR